MAPAVSEKTAAIAEKVAAIAEKVAAKANFLKGHYTRLVGLLRARDFLAECLATFMLVTVGDGAVAQFVFCRGSLTFLSVNAGYAIGLMIGAYMAGGVTGGHMNPAVTLAMAVRGKTKWIKVIPYWIAQMLGAFLGAAVVYGAYVDLINDFDGQLINDGFNSFCLKNGTVTPKLPLCTGGIFSTYPNPALQTGSGFFNELLGTFILTIGIFGIIDAGNSEVMSGLKPFMVGLTFWGVGASFGITTGYALNPARDLAPRIFSAMAGWGADVFVCSQCSISHYWWIPVTAPMLGAVLAAVFYWLMVEANHPSDKTYDVSGGKKETDTEELTENAEELTENAA